MGESLGFEQPDGGAQDALLGLRAAALAASEVERRTGLSSHD
jgi:hypothetical protein